MIYLDYSATTPVNKEVIESYSKACERFIGNPNSLHRLGTEAKEVIDASTKQIADILKIKPTEIIYTSGASESNNTAIKGIALKYANRGKHIISTELEHSSIVGPLNYLMNLGYEIDFVSLKENGEIDLEELENLIRDDTILVSISSVELRDGFASVGGTNLQADYYWSATERSDTSRANCYWFNGVSGWMHGPKTNHYYVRACLVF